MRGSRFARFAIATAMLAVLEIGGVAAPRPAVAAPLTYVDDGPIVYAPSPTNLERFGASVAVDGDTLVVGVPDHATDAGLLGAGIVHIYVRNSGAWVRQANLSQPTVNAGDGFGTSVAISGDRVVVGAPGYDSGATDSGAAFVFTRTGTVWSAGQMLAPADSASGDRAGQSVDIEGHTAVVGCPGADSGRGEVRPFMWDGTAWVARPVVQDADGQAGDELGGRVAVSGSTLLASAMGDDYAPHVDAGTVLVYTLGSGSASNEAKIPAIAPVDGERFGSSIDLGSGGAVAVIGSQYYDATAAADCGRAYVYVRGATGWQFEAVLENPTTGGSPQGDLFGSAVAYDGGDLILVGASGADGFDGSDGAAYYFQRRSGAWGFVEAVIPGESPCCEGFGGAVSLDAGIAAVGAPLASANT